MIQGEKSVVFRAPGVGEVSRLSGCIAGSWEEVLGGLRQDTGRVS